MNDTRFEVVLSVIIRAHNNKPLILDLIKSIKDNINRHTYEIIYVDNASSDGTQEELRKAFSDVIIIENEENLGPCKASNIGLYNAKGEIILILDSDVKILSGLDDIIDYMINTPECAAATGQQLNADGSYQPNVAKFPELSHAFYISLMHIGLSGLVKNTKIIRDYYMLDFDKDKAQPVNMIGLCCFFIKSFAYKVIGDQDERMFMYFEDVDWSYRLKQANLQIHYFPGLKIIHYGGQTTRKKSWAMNKVYQKSLKIFCEKHIYPAHNVAYNLFIKVLIFARYSFLYISRIMGVRFVGGAKYKKTYAQPGKN